MVFINTSLRSRSRHIASQPASRKLNFEALESRRLLAVFTPLPSDDGAPDSLRTAVVASQSNGVNDTIELGEGIYILRLGDLLINERDTNLRIEGAGPKQTAIKIEGNSRAFDVDFHARLELAGVAILAGNSDEGGQIRSVGTVVLTDAVLHGGTAIQGGAIFNGGNLTLTNVELVANEAGVGGGVWNHAGATLSAKNTRWVHNLTSKRLGEQILSPAQVGIDAPDDGSVFSLPPRGATALFNAGTAHLHSVVIAGNVSQTGAVIHNVGDTAELRIEDSAIYENESTTRDSRAPSFLLGMRGNVDVLQTAVFNNSSRDEYGGTITLFDGSIDLNHVALFNNSSPSYGFKVLSASVRMEHVTYVRSGPRSVNLTGAAHTVFEIAASAIDRISTDTRGGQFISGGGNWIGIGGKAFTHPTDRWLPSDKQSDLFWNGESFEFLAPGVYQGRIALPPTATSELIDALPGGEDAGAFEYVTGLTMEAPLPNVESHDLTIQEDGAALVLESLLPNAVAGIAARGNIFINDQGQLVYQTESNFEGHDRVVIQNEDGHLQSWLIRVTPQPDPPTIEDHTVTVLGRSEVLGKEKPDAETLTDLNAVSGTYDTHWLIPPGNATPGPDLDAEITAQGFVVDGQLVLGGPKWTDERPVPYWLTGDLARPNVDVEYIPPAGFSGTETRTVRVVNSSGLSTEATATFNVLDPAEYGDIARITAVILDENLKQVDTVRVGDLFFVEYRVEDIRATDYPLEPVQRGFYALKSIFNIGGAPLQIGEVCWRPDCSTEGFAGDGMKTVPPAALGGWLDGTSPPTQLDASHLQIHTHLTALSRRSGAFYRVAINATGPGTITADTFHVVGRGADISGRIPFDWFEIVPDSVQVLASHTNTAQREDVNQDQLVTAMDALIVINALNEAAESETASQAASSRSQFMWDVNGDGQLAPLDALLVVNFLNRNADTGTPAEGESSDTHAQPWSHPSHDLVQSDKGLHQLLADAPSPDKSLSESSNMPVQTPAASHRDHASDTVWARIGEARDQDDLNEILHSLLDAETSEVLQA